MDLWSVIIYGRTKEADYRFLAIPNDFEVEERNWARKYIYGTTVYREKLPGNPRWSIFKNDKHCVFGVTCMVKELIGSEQGYEYMAKDAGGRSLHIFVGYVAKINKYFNSLKILLDLEDLEFFKSEYLLTSLENLWHLKDYQLIDRKINEYPYNLELNYSRVIESRGYIDVSNKFIPPNFIPCLEENQAYVWPDNLEYRQNLWENCCKFFNYPHKHISFSLCLGLPQKKDVLEGPFLNATTSDATQYLRLVKPKSKVLNDASKTTAIDKREAANNTSVKSKLYSLSWRYLIWILSISAFTFLIFLIIKKYILATIMSLLIGFYLGRIFENSKIKNSITSRIKNKKNHR